VKISSISLKDFSIYQNTKMELKRINWFFGNNNTGKTSLIKALLSILVDDTDKKYIRGGAKAFEVSTRINDTEFLLKQGKAASCKINNNPSNRTALNTAIYGIMGIDPSKKKQVEAAIKTNQFLSLNNSERINLLNQALGVSFTVEKVNGLYVEYCNKNGFKPTNLGLERYSSGNNGMITQGDINDIIKKAKKMNSEVTSSNKSLGERPEGDITYDANQHNKLRERSNEIIRILNNMDAWDTIPQDIRNFDPIEGNKQLESFRASKQEAMSRKAATTQSITTLKRIITTLDTGTCPLDLKTECKTIDLSYIKGKLAEAEESLAGINFLDNGHIQVLQRNISEHDKYLTLQKNLKSDKTSEELIAEQSEVSKELDRLYQASVVHNQAQLWESQKIELENKKKLATSVLKSFRESIQPAFFNDIRKFLVNVTEFVNYLSDKIYHITVDDLGILSISVDGGNFYSIDTASESEKFRIGLSIQHLLNLQLGIKLLILDRVDVLDNLKRQALVKTIYGFKDYYDTIMSFTTITSNIDINQSPLVNIPDTAVFLLKDGECTQVKSK